MVDPDATKHLIERHEGRRSIVYRDIYGIPTIGIGFNLQRQDATQKLLSAGIDPGTNELSEEQIDALFDVCVDECEGDLKSLFPAWDEMPDEAQQVLMDLRFNLGPTVLRKFKITLDAFRRGQYREAASLLEASKWAKQVPKRAAEDCAILRRISG